MAVAYDATGAGAFGVATSGSTGTTLTWTHTFGSTAGSVVVCVNGHGSGDTDDSLDFTRSLSIAGIPMKLNQVQDLGALDQGDGWGEIWSLTGANVTAWQNTTQTFTLNEYFTSNSSTNWPGLIANSVSYSGVVSSGPGYFVQSETGTTYNVTVPSNTGHMVINGVNSNSIGGLSGTSRYNKTYTAYLTNGGVRGNENLVIQDSAGSSPSTTMTSTGVGFWVSQAIDMSPINQVFADNTGSSGNGAGVGYTSVSNDTSFSFSHTATAGAYVVLAVSCTPCTLSSVKYGTTNMTLLQTVYDNNNSTNGVLFFYGVSNVAGGTATVSGNTSTGARITANTVGYINVGQVSAGTTNFGNGTALSSGSITCSTGQMIVNALAYGNGGGVGTLSSPTGGINRSIENTYVGISISDSLTSGTTFGVTVNGTENWASGSVLLTPQQTLTDGANQSVTVNRSPAGSKGFTGGANTTAVTFTRSVAGHRTFSDGANTSVTFSRTQAGHRGANSGANASVTVSRSPVGRRGVSSSAVRSVAFGFTANSGFHWTDSANRSFGLASSPGAHMGLHGAASSVLVFVPSVHDLSMTVTGSWPADVSGLVSFISFTPIVNGAYEVYPEPAATAEIVDGVLSASMKITSGDYLVMFSEVTVGGHCAQIHPFVFQCPANGGVVELNEIVSTGAQAVVRTDF